MMRTEHIFREITNRVAGYDADKGGFSRNHNAFPAAPPAPRPQGTPGFADGT